MDNLQRRRVKRRHTGLAGAYLPTLLTPQARRCLVGLAGAGLALRAWQRIEVTGDSMRPLLVPGDRVLIWRFGSLREGDVVALREPRDGRLVIKRIETCLPGRRFEVRGDNKNHSTDSRHFGPVGIGSVVGRAVYRYAPEGRTLAFRRRTRR